MARKQPPPSAAAAALGNAAGLYQLGDRVRILRTAGLKGRIVELRGPLGPGGVQIYRVRVRRKPKPKDIELRADQLELLTEGA